jgi:DNA polymerase III subunit delta
MTPDEFLRSIEKRDPQPAYLFVGPEAWARDRCRRALIDRVLPQEEDREQGMTRHDLCDVELSTVIDDARSFSLFATRRVIWASGAEAALPKRDTGDSEAAANINAYLKDPPQGVVVVFDCSRYEFEGDDKAKIQRVEKFYSMIAGHVEFARHTPEAARKLAEQLARERGLQIGPVELDALVELLAADVARISTEIEKLSLYAGTERRVTEDDIFNLAPSAKASTIFALVNALGRNDRTASLESLDVLVREGEYLPLALSFLATQFRLAYVAKEAKLSGASQVQNYFTKQGTPMWRSRAEQVAQTSAAFSAEKLRTAAIKIYETDKALRDARPDDRTVMERFVLELTARN